MSRESKNKKKRLDIDWTRFFNTRHAETSSEPGPVAAHTFSGNLLVVLGVLAFILFLSWGSLSSYLQQRGEISQVKSDISRLQSQNATLNDQLNLWKDDNYAREQAKIRLYYVSQGETSYMVTGLDQTSSLADGTSASALTAPETSWYDRLWGSFQAAAIEQKSSAASTAGSVSPTSTASSTAQPASSASAGLEPSSNATNTSVATAAPTAMQNPAR